MKKILFIWAGMCMILLALAIPAVSAYAGTAELSVDNKDLGASEVKDGIELNVTYDDGFQDSCNDDKGSYCSMNVHGYIIKAMVIVHLRPRWGAAYSSDCQNDHIIISELTRPSHVLLDEINAGHTLKFSTHSYYRIGGPDDTRLYGNYGTDAVYLWIDGRDRESGSRVSAISYV